MQKQRLDRIWLGLGDGGGNRLHTAAPERTIRCAHAVDARSRAARGRDRIGSWRVPVRAAHICLQPHSAGTLQIPKQRIERGNGHGGGQTIAGRSRASVADNHGRTLFGKRLGQPLDQGDGNASHFLGPLRRIVQHHLRKSPLVISSLILPRGEAQDMVSDEVPINQVIANQHMGQRQRQGTVASRRDGDPPVDAAARPARRHAKHARAPRTLRAPEVHGLPRRLEQVRAHCQQQARPAEIVFGQAVAAHHVLGGQLDARVAS